MTPPPGVKKFDTRCKDRFTPDVKPGFTRTLKNPKEPLEPATVGGGDSERPNIFTVYEQNIGTLTPFIADSLKDIEKEYPARWFEDAVKIAVEANTRKLNYINGILKRWQTDGKDDRPKYSGPPVPTAVVFTEKEIAEAAAQRKRNLESMLAHQKTKAQK